MITKVTKKETFFESINKSNERNNILKDVKIIQMTATEQNIFRRSRNVKIPEFFHCVFKAFGDVVNVLVGLIVVLLKDGIIKQIKS